MCEGNLDARTPFAVTREIELPLRERWNIRFLAGGWPNLVTDVRHAPDGYRFRGGLWGYTYRTECFFGFDERSPDKPSIPQNVPRVGSLSLSSRGTRQLLRSRPTIKGPRA